MATTWDPATVALVTLSGGNLIATSTGTTEREQGAHVAFAQAKNSGKWYFEATVASAVGGDVGIGIGTTTSTFTGIGYGGGVTGANSYIATGNIWINGANAGTVGGISGLVGIAVDLDNRKIWYCQPPSSAWNSGAGSPAANTGGLAISAGAMVPFCTFGDASGAPGGSWTANFGASAFVGAIPVGFLAWDPSIAAKPFLIHPFV